MIHVKNFRFWGLFNPILYQNQIVFINFQIINQNTNITKKTIYLETLFVYSFVSLLKLTQAYNS